MPQEESASLGDVNRAFDSSGDQSRGQDVPENVRLAGDLKKTYDSNGRPALRDVDDNDDDAGRDADDESTGGTPKQVESSRRRCCPRPGCGLCTTAIVFCGIFHFSFVGAYGCVLPYVSIYMKQLGLSPQQIGLISGLRPIVGFCSAPFWGALGDQFRIRRPLLILSLVSWLAFFVGLFHIRPPAEVSSCPTDVVIVRRGYIGPLLRGRLLSAGHDGAGDALDVTDDVINPVDRRRVAVNDTDVDWTPDEIESMTMYRGWMYEGDSLWRVFVTCLSLIVTGEVFQSPASALSDTGTLHTLEETGLSLDNYGYIRAWGALGYGISSFAAGALVSSSRRKEVFCGVELYFSDYRLLVYIFIVFLVIAFVAATQIKFKEGKPKEEVELNKSDKKTSELNDKNDISEKTHNAGAVVRIFFNVHYGSWLATSFFVGICNGVIWGFLYWHLDNLGASQFLMGVSGVVVCVSEFVMFFLVDKVITLLGHIGIMYLGLVGYAVRFCIYAVISNPWWVLPAEVLQGITFSIVWVSMTAYTTMAVPSASLGTIQGILHGVYFGLGSGSGHLIGGIMIGYIGAVITFFTFAAASVFVLIIFVIAQKCSTKPENVYGYTNLDEETEKNSASKTDLKQQ